MGLLTEFLEKKWAKDKANASMYGDIIKGGNLSPLPPLPDGASPEDTQKWQAENEKRSQNYDYAVGQLKKYAGGGGGKGGAKEIFDKLEHGVKSMWGARPGGGGGNGQPSAMASAPPGTAAPIDDRKTTSQAGLPPPPEGASATAPGGGLTPPPEPKADMNSALKAAHPSPEAEDERAFALWKRQQDVLKQYKIEEAKAAAENKAANPSGRPVMGPATSVQNARELAKQGKSFQDSEGNPIDLTALPDNMGLKFIAWGPKHYYEAFSPNQKVITVGNETYAISPMDAQALGTDGTALGQHLMPSTSATTDPATGQTTVTHRTPATTGVQEKGAGGAAGTPSGGAAGAPRATGTPAGGGTGSGKGKGAAASASGPVTLDESGHIPASTPGQTPQIIQGANDLIDGTALSPEKLPAKTRALSEALAKRAGWDQGKFNRLEQTQIALATRYIDEALKSPSLKSLDGDFIARLPMIGATTESKGLVGKASELLASKGLTENQAEFLRLYKQMAGTISGLGKLSRGGRITEATVNRLLSELPNPANTKDSKDAVARLQRLRDEVNTAMSQGQFVSPGAAMKNGPPGSKPSGPVKWTRNAQGDPVPVSQ